LVVQYATGQTGNTTVVYSLTKGSNEINYKYPSDIEYFQVLTAITISDAIKLWSGQTNNSSTSLKSIIEGYTKIYWNNTGSGLQGNWQNPPKETKNLYYSKLFEDYNNQYITILQRGVDPYSPIYTNKYGIGRLLGLPNETDINFTASTRLNIPIQKLTNTNNVSVQDFRTQDSTFYSSYFFRPGRQWSGFTTTNLGYYGALDAQYRDFLQYSPNLTLRRLYATTNDSIINNVNCVISDKLNDTYQNIVGTLLEPQNAYYDAS
jgi:hypothetical protein